MAHRACPWWLGYLLIIPLRRWRQDPSQIIGPYVSEGMIVLEPGPGMGFFTLELARRVGPTGRVIAIDVHRKMIEGLAKRAAKAGLASRIEARLAQENRLGIQEYNGQIDFALAFAMVHEVPNPAVFFADIHNALKPGGKLLFAEPAVHVRVKAFELSLEQAREAGFTVESRPKIWHSHAAVLVRS